MNSLTELNGYASALSFDFTDNRSANVTFDRATPTNQTAIIDEGFTLSTPIGIEITEIINSDVSAPTYTINVSSVAGTTVTWASLPSGVTASTPSTGVYRLSGLKTKAHWDAIKTATITPPSSYNGIFSYTSTIAYYSQADGNLTKAWTTTVTVNDVVFLTTPLEFTYPASATTTIANTTQIVNVDASYPGATWTVVATPSSTSSIDTFTTTGTGGTFSVNSTTKVITISGTRAQVNSRLAGLQIDSNSTSVDFSITFALSNNQNGTTDSNIQVMKSQGLIYLGAVTTPTIYFTEDAASVTMSGIPLITDSSYDGSGEYTFTVTPSNTSAIRSMATTGTEGSSSFNATTKVLTVLGTRSQINTRMLTMTLSTAVDWGTDFTLSYAVSTPREDTASKLQVLACGSNDIEITNMNVTRSYIGNRENTVFSSDIPNISDFDTAESNTYTISFSSSLGLFGFATETPVSTLTFTGTKAQCNAKFSAVRFWPTAGVSSNGTFTYIQQKNGVEQVNQNVTFTGTAGTYQDSRTISLTDSTQWTPTFADYQYGQFAICIVGGGGGGGYYRAGGGGGGEVKYYIDQQFRNQTYTATIGAPGLGGGSNRGFTGIYNTGLQNGSSGGTTTFSTSGQSFSANGGSGGTSFLGLDGGNQNPKGGAAGGGNAGGDGAFTTISYNLYSGGGGGGGAGSVGYTCTLAADGSVATKGTGGASQNVTVTLNGSSFDFGSFGGGGGGGTESSTTGTRFYGSGWLYGFITGTGAGAYAGSSNPANGYAEQGAAHGGGGGGGNSTKYDGANGFEGIVKLRIYSK
jgi:hypothetical protein